MPPRRLLMWVFVCCLLVSSLLACDGLPGISLSGSSTDTTTADGHPLNEWLAVKTGIELRYEHWKAPSGDEDTVIITRVDPTKTQISVGYQPDKPLQLKDWQKQTNATMIVNGGYFDLKIKQLPSLSQMGNPMGYPIATVAVCSLSIAKAKRHSNPWQISPMILQNNCNRPRRAVPCS